MKFPFKTIMIRQLLFKHIQIFKILKIATSNIISFGLLLYTDEYPPTFGVKHALNTISDNIPFFGREKFLDFELSVFFNVIMFEFKL
jgi:hypothetical protein